MSGTAGRRGVSRYVWLGPLVGFLTYVTGLMAEEVFDPVTTWLRDQSTGVVSAVVSAIGAFVIWLLVRREKQRRRRIESIRTRIASGGTAP